MSVGDLTVEILLGASWTNITSYVRVTDGGTVTIRRGKMNEQAAPGTAQCTLQLKNTDGRFSPTNASGAYYGTFGRNTQLRVKVKNDAGVDKVRFHGEVSAWPVAWDPTGKDVWATITASGIRRRLTRSGIPFLSPYRRAMALVPDVVAYWPMEDSAGSSYFAPGPPSSVRVPNGTFSGPGVRLAADNTFASSAALPQISNINDQMKFTFPSYTQSAAGLVLRWVMSATASSGTPTILFDVRTNGTLNFEVSIAPIANTATLFWSDSTSGAAVSSSGAGSLAPFNAGQQLRWQLALKQNGTGVDYSITWLAPGQTSGVTFGATIPSQTLGRLVNMQVFNGNPITATIGQVSLTNAQPSIFDLAAVLDGYAGETAFQRVTRLVAEEGVTATLTDSTVAGKTEIMGAQGEDTFINLFDQAAQTEGGLSTEIVDDLGLVWRARTDLSRPHSEVVIMAYTDTNALQPTADDESTINDVTVQRIGGGSATAQAVEGLTVGVVGDYPQTYSLSQFSDSQTLPMAQWLAGVGANPAARWPLIGFDALKLSNALGVRDAVFLMREGDGFRIDGLPAFTGAPNPLRVMVDGWTEVLSTGQWQFTLNCSSADPYELLLLDNTAVGFLDQFRLGIGDPVATWGYVANQILTAAELNAAQPIVVAKQVTESLTSNVTLQNDDELFVTLNAGQSYEVEVNLIINGSATSGAGDFKCAWARTGTLNQVGARQCTGPSIRTIDSSGTTATAGTLPNILGILRRTGGHALTTAVNYGTDGTATGLVQERFIIQAAVTGVLTLQWAQDTTSATATQVVAGSYIIARPVA